MQKIGFVVSPNGFGQIKRVLVVSRVIYELAENTNITIHYPELAFNKLLKLNGFGFRDVIKKSNFLFEFMENAPTWNNRKFDDYDQYSDWGEKICSFVRIQKYDLIISDNYLLPFRDQNFILMGSFIWGLLLNPTNHTHKKIIDEELKSISQKYDILCLKEFVMPQIKQILNPIELPFFCDIKPQLNHNIQNAKLTVLITGGGTTNSDSKLTEITKLLNKGNNCIIYLDEKLFKLNNIADFSLFSYKEEDYKKIDLIICRPGIGIITESIEYNIPIFPILEVGNKELLHNAKRIELLGMGKIITHSSEIIRSDIFAKNHLKRYRENIIKFDVGGHIIAAKYILNKIRHE
jgi:hypothetical protein